MNAADLIFTTSKDQLTAINPKNQEWIAGVGPGPNFDQSSSRAGQVVIGLAVVCVLIAVVRYFGPLILGHENPSPPNDIRPIQGSMLMGIAAFLGFFGLLQVRYSRGNTVLSTSATHIIGATVGPASRVGTKGEVTAMSWQAQSPESDQTLGGHLQFGRMNSRHGRITQGMVIPVLWKSDRELAPL